MKPRTIVRIILVIIVIVLFVRNYILRRDTERRQRESVQWVDTGTFGNTTKANGGWRDLSRDDERGGHTLRRHVGKTDEELRERLTQERISAASTYTDRNTAETVVGNALAQNKDRITSWLQKPGGHPNLVLDYGSDKPLGRTLHRGDSESQPCSHSVVVLKWVSENDYYVLTSYPQCGTANE